MNIDCQFTRQNTILFGIQSEKNLVVKKIISNISYFFNFELITVSRALNTHYIFMHNIMRALLVAIIDDDRFYQSALRSILAAFSPATKTQNFMNGKEGFELLIQNRNSEHELPDCIFLDIEMPLMNGLTFLDKFDTLRNSLKKDIKIFIISSSLTEKNRQIIDNYPFVKRCIPKPFKRIEIEKLLLEFMFPK